MAETRKPNYFFAPDSIEEEENCQETMASEEVLVEVGDVFEVDFEEVQARWWPGDPFEC
jgi:hypothetical protein